MAERLRHQESTPCTTIPPATQADMAIFFLKLPLYVDLLFREFLPSFNFIPFGAFLQLIKSVLVQRPVEPQRKVLIKAEVLPLLRLQGVMAVRREPRTGHNTQQPFLRLLELGTLIPRRPTWKAITFQMILTSTYWRATTAEQQMEWKAL